MTFKFIWCYIVAPVTIFVLCSLLNDYVDNSLVEGRLAIIGFIATGYLIGYVSGLLIGLSKPRTSKEADE